MSPAEKMAEMLKFARSGWVTRHQIHIETGVALMTIQKWTRSFVESGILLERSVPNRLGVSRYEYVVAPEWGGPTK
jgi:hypothetical protein